jgi:integrase
VVFPVTAEEVVMFTLVNSNPPQEPWNKGRLIGQKRPLKLQEIWGIRIRLQLEGHSRDLALFNLAIDSKLRGCDLVRLKVSDIIQGGRIRSRAQIIQRKTLQPVQFEIMEQTRESLASWVSEMDLRNSDYLFPSRVRDLSHLSTRQYSRIVDKWVTRVGLDPTAYGTHTMRRTKASLIYRRTKNLRAIQLLLGHTKLESTVRYLGIDVEDALELAENTEV